MEHLRRKRSFEMSDRRVTRRQVLRGTALGLGLPAVSALLAACGRDHTDELGLDRLGDAPAPQGPTLSFLSIQPHERAARPDIEADDFISSIYDPYTLVDGKRYGLPFDGDSHVLFYNQDLLARSGFGGPPGTWEQYVQMARKITDDNGNGSSGVYGAVLPAQAAPIIIGSAFANRLAGYGGHFLDGDCRPALDSRAVAAANSMHELAVFTPSPVKIAFEAAVAMFLEGKAAMMEFWTDLGVNGEDPKQSKVRGRWGVTSLPVGSPNSKRVAALNAGFALGVSRASRNQDLATRCVKVATSKATNLERITTTGSGIDPTRRSTLNSPSTPA